MIGGGCVVGIKKRNCLDIYSCREDYYKTQKKQCSEVLEDIGEVVRGEVSFKEFISNRLVLVVVGGGVFIGVIVGVLIGRVFFKRRWGRKKEKK